MSLPLWLVIAVVLLVIVTVIVAVRARVDARAYKISNDRLQAAACEHEKLNQHYQEVTLATEDGIYFWEADGDQFWANDRLKEIVWGTAETDLKRSSYATWDQWIECIHPDDKTGYLEGITLRGQQRALAWQQQYRIQSSDGKCLHVLDRTYTHYNDLGEPITESGVVTDISDIVEAQEALQKNLTRFENLVDNSPGVIFRLRGNPDALDENPELEYLSKHPELSYPIGEVEGYSLAEFWKLVHPDDYDLCVRETMACIIHGTPYEMKYRVVDLDGKIHWNLARGQQVIDPKDGTPYVDGIVLNITDMVELSQKLEYQASHDALTGLMNRREFGRQLDEVIGDSKSGGGRHVLCYLDLDQFKLVNDTCGHMAGDELLCQLASHMGQQLTNHTLARLGGDEFGILFRQTSASAAEYFCEQLRASIKSFQFSWEGRPFFVDASFGLVEISAETVSAYWALSMADTACYMSKEQGGRHIVLHRERDLDVHRRQGEMEWISRIQEALIEDRFEFHFQPIVTTDENANPLKMCELLIRMREKGQLIPPGAFIAAAERYKISPQIDRWVISHAFDWIQSVCDQLPWDIYSINLSGISLSDEELLAFVVDKVHRNNLDARRICFEITETAAITNLVKANHFIKTLSDIGCEFAIDDFGSGLSSFNYLKSLPARFLKIDGAFVQGLEPDSVNHALIKSINDIGQVMGKMTIAEHVENAQELELLTELGVDFVQGYHLSKPRPINEMDDYFQLQQHV